MIKVSTVYRIINKTYQGHCITICVQKIINLNHSSIYFIHSVSYNHKIGCPEIILFLMMPMHEGLKKQTSIFNITLSS